MFRAMKGRPPIGGVKSAVMVWPFSYSIQTKYKNGQQKIQKDFLGYAGIMIANAFGGGINIGKTLGSSFFCYESFLKESFTCTELFHTMRYTMDGFEAGSSELIFRGPVQSTVEEYKIYYSDERKSERRCGFLNTWTLDSLFFLLCRA